MTEPQKISPRWLDWAREIQALSQSGSHYALNDYDRQRYSRLSQIAAEITHEHSRLPLQDLLGLYGQQKGYATPKVDVRGAVFQGDKLLLVQERQDGGWTMPGGWADVGNVPSEAAEREVWEEAGFRVKVHRVIGVYDANRSGPLELFHAFKIIFLCDLISGEATPSIETSAVAFFAQNKIPAKLSGERTLLRHIQDVFAVHNHPDLPTVFD